MTDPNVSSLSYYVQLAPDAASDLADVVREWLRCASRPDRVVVAITDVSARLMGRPAGPCPTPVRTWIGYLLAAGLRPDQIVVYRQSDPSTLAGSALLLGRWVDVRYALDPDSAGMAATAAPMLTTTDVLAHASGSTVAYLGDPERVSSIVAEVRSASSFVPTLACRLAPLHELPGLGRSADAAAIDASALGHVAGLPIDASVDVIQRRIRRLPTSDAGHDLRVLHGVLARSTGCCACRDVDGYDAMKRCTTSRLLAVRDNLSSRAGDVTARVIDEVCDRALQWASDRCTDLYRILSRTPFAPTDLTSHRRTS
jgi:hypothetical protein